jgi:hypothetical protein
MSCGTGRGTAVAKQRSQTDYGRRRVVRDNWYRDVWLVVITGLVLVALARGQDTTDHTAALANRTAALAEQVARYQQSNTQSLCTLRADLQRRITQSKDFLVTHPNGIPGIPAGTIRVGIVNQQHTLDALRLLECPKP